MEKMYKEIKWCDIQNGDIIAWSNKNFYYPDLYLMINKNLKCRGQCLNISHYEQRLTWLNSSSKTMIKFWYVDHIDLECLTL